MSGVPTQKTEADEVEIDPARLRPGMFVRLKLGWVSHPFLFNQFRIANADQIAQIQALGLKSVRYVPSRSTAAPLPPSPVQAGAVALAARPAAGGVPSHPEIEQTGSDTADPAVGGAPDVPMAEGAGSASSAASQGSAQAQAPVLTHKALQARRIAEVRARIARCERGYTEAANQVRTVMQGIYSSAEKSVGAARVLVGNVVDGFGADGEMVIHLMNEKLADETAYFHVLNVMVLSLLLGREMRLPPELLKVLGEGALFHDIGKLRVPDPVLRNPRRNRHEEEFYRLHTVYGAEIAGEMGVLSPAVREVIELHHETQDGKGFPRGLAGDRIPILARVVAIANRYDNLCNPLLRNDAITPAEALAKMFRDEAGLWDMRILQQLIRMLGVYPPGSLVQLSNGNVALVVSVDHADLLRPSVMIFDPAVPRAEAIVIDLVDEPDVQIDLAIKPRDLEPAAADYLAPRRRMSYYHSQRGG